MIWAAALLMGLASGLHCIGMCGPLSMAIPVPAHSKLSRPLALGIYHFSRIIVYMMLGFVAALLGLSILKPEHQQWLSIALGLMVVIMAWFPALISRMRWSPAQAILGKIKSGFHQYMRNGNASGFLVMGALNGLLPCGMVYLAIASSLLNGEAVSSAYFMMFFGMGTLPTVYFMPLIASGLFRHFNIRAGKLFPVVMTMVGLVLMLRGMGLGIPYLSPEFQLTAQGHQAAMHCAP